MHLERLEDRLAPAVLYVDNSMIGGAGAGQGTFTPNGGDQTAVAGLTLGTNLFTTIGAAVTAAAPGDTIDVADGTFAEQVAASKTGLIFQGNKFNTDGRDPSRGINETIVTGVGNNGLTPFSVTANNVQIAGFTVEGATNGNNLGFGIVLGAGTAGSQVRNNVIQNNIAGLSLANNSGANQTVIQRNLFQNNNQSGPVSGTGIYTDQFNAGGALTNVLIDNNTFTNNQIVGVLLGSTQAASQSAIGISNNTFSANGNAVLLFNTTSSSVTGNTLTGSLFSQLVIGGGVNGLQVSQNFIQNGATRGIRIGDFGGGGTNSNVTINDNNISGNAVAGLEIDAAAGAYTGTLNAENNYWGSPTGPMTPENPGGTGDKIIAPAGQADFSPFRTSGTDSQPGTPGFQPAANGPNGIAVQGTAGGDLLEVFTGPGSNNGFYQLNGGPLMPFIGITSFSFAGLGGNDIFRINNPAGGLFAPVNGIFYDGGTQTGAPGDSLEVLGGAHTAETHTFTPDSAGNQHNGTIALVNGATTANYTYTNLAPVLVDAGTPTNIIFNLPSGDGDNMARLEDDAGAVAGLSQIRSLNGSFETTTFVNPTTSLTLNLGDEASGETAFLAALDPAYAATTNINGGTGGDSIRVFATPASQTNISTGNSDDIIRIGSAGSSLDTILGPISVAGQAGGADTLIVLDNGDTDANTYVVTATTITRNAGPAITFATTEVVNLNAGTNNDTITVQGTAPGVTLNIDGGTGSDTLTGPNATNTWNITGTNQGNITGVVNTFTNVENLTGGTGTDNFVFSGNASNVTGTIDGGTGTDTLDYSARTTAVSVNLGANAPGLTSSLDSDQEVPPHVTNAAGTATITYNNTAHTFDITLNVTGVSPTDPGLRFHIHRAPTGVNGPIIASLFDAPGAFSAGTLTPTGPTSFTFTATGVPLNPLDEAALLGGITYLNVHDTAFPGGEIRGQVFASGLFVAATGTATGTGGVVNVENVTGGSGNDSLVGDNNSNILRGGPGNDVIVGARGSDTLQGEANDDILAWSNGDGSDVMDGGTGTDLVNVNGAPSADDAFTIAGSGSRVAFARTNLVPFTLDIGTTESLTVNGNSGNDTFSLTSLLLGVADLTTVNLNGFDGNDTFNVHSETNVTINVTGHLPRTAPGDTLNFDALGLAVTDNGSQITQPGRMPVNYAGIETITTTNTTSSITVNGTGANDTLVVTATGTNSGSYSLDGGPPVAFVGITSFTFNGMAGNDTFIVNNPAGGLFAPTGGIIYDGGTQTGAPGDALQVLGGQATTETFTFTPDSPGNQHNGTIALVNGATTANYTYSNLSPVLVNAGTPTAIVFNLPGGDGNNQAILEDNGLPADNMSQIRSQNVTFETTTFVNPTGSLTVNYGNDGEDVDLTQLDPAFTAPIVFNGGTGSDRLQVDFTSNNVIPVGGITFNGAAGADSFNLNPGYTATNVTYNYTNGTDGSVVVDGRTIAYTGLDSSAGNIDRLTAANRTFNLSGASDILTLNTGAFANDGFSRLTSGGTALLIDFLNPTSNATVNLGAGNDTITVPGFDAVGAPAIINLNGFNGTDPGAASADGSDTFNVTPSAGSTFNVDGDRPAPPTTPGDTLNVNTAGTTSPTFTSTATAEGFTGSYTFGNRMPVNFQEIESFGAVTGAITVNGTPGNDTLVVTATGPDSGSYSLNGGPPVAFAGITSFTFNGLAGNDIFRINNPAGGLFAPAGGIIYDGGTQTGAPGDSLEILGGQAITETFTFTPDSAGNQHNGTIALVNGATTANYTYSNLSPVLVAAGTPTNIIFNLPTGDGNNQAILEDNGVPADNMSQIRSQNGTFETTQFVNPTGSLTVNYGNDGEDVDLTQLDPAYTAPIVFNGGTGNDRLQVDFTSNNVIPVGDITFNGAAGADSFNLNPGYTATNVTYNYTNGTDGSVVVDGRTIAYTGLDSSAGNIDRLTASTRIFNLSGAADILTLDTGGIPNDGFSRLTSGGTALLIDFRNPTTSLTLNSGPGDDLITLRALDAAAATPTTIVINGQGGNDALTVDFAAGNPIPTGGLTYDGGTQTGAPGDSLTILGGAFNTDTYTYTAAGPNGNNGNIALDPDGPGGTAPSVITYTNLAPITNTGTATNIVFTLPSGDGDNGASLGDDGGAGDPDATNDAGFSALFGTGFEYTEFNHVGTATVQINLGNEAAGESFFLQPLEASYTANTTVNGGTGGDSIRIFATNTGTTTTVNGGGSDDVIRIGSAGSSLDTIAGAVTVNGDAGAGDTLFLLDDGDPDANTYTVTGTTVNRAGAALITYNTTEVLLIDSGTGGSTFNVQGTSAATLTRINAGGGNDIVNVGSATNSLDGITAPLTVNGEGGTDILNLNDQGDVDPNNYTITSTTVARTGAALITYGTVEALNINAGDGNNNFLVQSTAAGTPLVITANGGNDTAILGLAGTLDNILSTVTFVGGAGTDTLTLDDSADADGDTYIFNSTSTSVTRSGGPTVNYDGTTETVNLSTGPGNDIVFITPSPTTTYNLDGGAPNTSPGDILIYDAQGRVVTNNGTSLTAPGVMPVNYINFESVSIANAAPTIAINDVTMAEGSGGGTTNFVFTVTLSTPNNFQTVTVQYTTQDGSATTADGDYALTAGTLTFLPGQTSMTITVPVTADNKFEPTENFFVNLSAPTNATFGDAQGVGTITNDDLAPTISINDVTMAEGNAGTTAFTFTVTLSNPSFQTVTVDFATADGTALVADNDYAAKTGTLTFAPNTTTQTITVLVTGDTKFEPTENFLVNLSNASAGSSIADPQGVGTITNDDVAPTASINDVTMVEGNAGTTAFVFTVTLTNGSQTPVTIDFATQDGTATTADGDYVANAGTLTFANGVTTQTITVLVNGDTKFEPNETFFVNLSNPVGTTFTDAQGQGTITNDDAQPTISINDVTANEGNAGTSTFTFTVSLSNPSAQTVTVAFTTTDGTATTADGDYLANAGTLTFAPGVTTQTVNVTVNGDTKFEPTETFTVNLSAPTNATIADPQGVGTITNDDVAPTASINDVTMLEGNAGTTAFVFTVTLTNGSQTPVTIDFATQDGTATTADLDYVANAGTLTFGNGVTTQTITVLVNGDTKFEPNETFFVNLTNPVGTTFTDAQGQGTITNDDAQPTISINDVTVIEGNAGTTPATFTVTLSNPSSQTVTVNFTTTDGTATAGSDYVANAGTLTFAPGVTTQTVTVNVNGDTAPEPNETFTVNLSAPTNATIANGSGLGTITNDDVLADLVVTVIDTPDPVTAGSILTYTVTVTNSGPADAVNATLTDSVPNGTTFNSVTSTSQGTATQSGGIVTANFGTIVAGTSATLVFMVNVLANNPNGATITDAATATSTTADPNAGNNTGTATTTVNAQADLSVTKTDAPDPVIAGQNLTYTITVSNAGPSDAQTVSLTDAVPANVTFVSFTQTAGPGFTATATPAVGGTGTVTRTLATLAAGAGATFTFVVNVNANVAQGGTVTNTALVGSSTTDPNGGNNSDTQITTVNAQADVAVTKTDAPDPVIAGSNLTYTITVTNTGSSDAQTVSLNDAVPTNTTFVSFAQTAGPAFTATATPPAGGSGPVTRTLATLAAGASATFTFVVNVNANVLQASTITNTATVGTTTTDTNAGNNSATQTTAVNAQADVAVTKTDSPDPVVAGQNLTYTITVSNTGPSDAQAVSLNDGVPINATFVSFTQTAGPAFTTTATPAVGSTGTVTRTLATLAAGVSATFSFVVNVNANVLQASTITNTATVGTTTTDTNGANNSATQTTAVNAQADLAVTKTDSPDPVVAGQNLTYTITVSNTGPSDAQAVSLTDVVPANATFVSFAQTAGPAFATTATPPAGGSGAVTRTLSTLAAGASATFSFVVNVNANVAQGGTVTNTASVSSGTTDANGANNSATQTTAVNAQADLAVTKTDSPDPVVAGQNLTYTITVSNTGPSDAQAVSLTDVVPGGTTFVSFTAPAGWTTTSPGVGSTGTVTVTRPTQAAGATATFTFVVKVNANVAQGGTVTNTASASSGTTEVNAANNSATQTTTVNAQADLSVTKTDSPDPVVAGQNLTYTITISNTGPSDAQGVTLTDAVPANATFVSFTQTAGPAFTPVFPPVGGTGTVTAFSPTLAAGAGATFTFVVNVNANVAQGGTVTNTANVTTTTTEVNGANNSATQTTTVNAQADLSVTKTDSPDPVVAGQNLTYTITVSNTGPSDAQTVSLNDGVPINATFVSFTQTAGPAFIATATPSAGGSGTVTRTLATLAAGASATFSFVVNVNANVLQGGTVTNTAAVGSATTEVNAANNSATQTTTVNAQADLAVTKTDSPDPVVAGQNLTYTITVTNAGPSDAQTVSLTDVVPANTTFVSFTQTAGPAFTVTATPAVGGTGTVTRTLATLAAGASTTFTFVVNVNANVAQGGTVTNTALVGSATTEVNAANNSAPQTTTVNAQADLSVTKTDSPDPVVSGQNLTYTITVTNAGPSDAQGVSLADVVPANTTFVSFAQTAGPVFTATATPAAGGTGAVTRTLATLAAGASATFTFVVNVNASTLQGSTLTNTASASSSTTEVNAANNSATQTTAVNALADLAVTKTDAPDPVVAGQNLTYTITVSNTGPSNAQGVSLTDVVPANTTFVSFAQTAGPSFSSTTPAVGGTGTVTSIIATLAAGASATFTFVVKVNGNVPQGGTVTNTANVTTTTTESSTANNSATQTTTVNSQADLSVTKTDSPDPVVAGQNLTYTITVSNAGPSDTQSVVLSDAVPANATFVSVSQTSGPAFTLASPGVGGTGTVTAFNSSLAAGASATFSFVVKVNANVAQGGTVTNTASASSGTTEVNAANNSATQTTAVNAQADLSITKTDSPDPVNAGTNLTYTITVSNAGPSDAQAMSLTDAVPANATFVSFTQTAGPAFTSTTPAVGATGTVTSIIASLAAGASATFTFVVKVNANAPQGGTVLNTASAATTTTETNTADNSATQTTAVISQADLSVTKTDAPDPVNAGTNLTYTITVSNAGLSDAQNVALTDVLPANTTFVSASQTSGPAFSLVTPSAGGTGTATAFISSLAAGASAAFTFVVKVNANTPQGTTLTNTAAVSSGTTDNNTANNSATQNTAVNTQADLSVTKTDSPDPVVAGTNLTYTITVTNAGVSSATGVVLTDQLPANTTFVSATPSQGTATQANGVVTANLGTLAPNGTATVTLVVAVSATTGNGATLSNTAVVSSGTTDLVPGNNTATQTTNVIHKADLSVSIADAPDPVLAGNNLTYTVTVSNAGPSPADNVVLTDQVPGNTTFVSVGSSQGTAGQASGLVTANLGTLAAGASATITLLLKVNADTPGGTTVVDTASVTTSDPDTTPGNNTAMQATTVGTQANLAVVKTVTPNPVVSGEQVTYTTKVTNNGPSDAQNVIVTDQLVFGTLFDSVTTSQGTASRSGATVTANLGTLNAGASVTVTVVSTVVPGILTGTMLTSPSSASSSTPDANTANNSASATATVRAPSTVGVWEPATVTWSLKNSNIQGSPDITPFQYGRTIDTPLIGDWDGDHRGTVGIFEPETAVWKLRNSNTAGGQDILPFAYGRPNRDIPVVGDWDGNGTFTAGVFEPETATWRLRNSNSAGPADIVFVYGMPGDIPVTGDWDGDGKTTIGVVRPNTMTWFLRNSNSQGNTDFAPFAYGKQGDVPVTGDWNGDGTTTVGVFEPIFAGWKLRNFNSAGEPNVGPFPYGGTNWKPVPGAFGTASPQRAGDGERTDGPVPAALSPQDLNAAVTAALTRFRAAGASEGVLTQLGQARFEVQQLPGPLLGMANINANAVVIDSNAAGHGWFLDATPERDEEFALAPWGALYAQPGTAAAGKMDLLTVVMHEMGHLIGLDDVDAKLHPGDLMGDLLGDGNRLTVALDKVFASGKF